MTVDTARSPMAGYRAARAGAALFPRPDAGLVEVTGAERHAYLNSLCTNKLDDLEGFAAEAEEGRRLGFDGKSLIHPSQIAPCHAAFAPNDEELARAERLVAAATGGAEVVEVAEGAEKIRRRDRRAAEGRRERSCQTPSAPRATWIVRHVSSQTNYAVFFGVFALVSVVVLALALSKRQRPVPLRLVCLLAGFGRRSPRALYGCGHSITTLRS